MKKVIVGHRGVGKSAFLLRHADYLKESGLDVPHLDLDAEIENHLQTTISTFFESNGELAFREVERKVFANLTAGKKHFVISLGAGFDLNCLPEDVEVLFIARATDEAGRIFLNRPRLNQKVSPLNEFKERFPRRQEAFLQTADTIYFMPEGLEAKNNIEKELITKNFLIGDAYYTIVKKEVPQIEGLKKNYKIELRTDLIQVATYLPSAPGFNGLVSIRTEEIFEVPKTATIDCDINLKCAGYYLQQANSIASCHVDSIQDAITALRPFKNRLKLSPLIESFNELIAGYKWQQEDPEYRSFLPRSENGKWVWYRQMAKYLQKLNYVRSFTVIKDQPSSYQWLTLPKAQPSQFAAVLGKPVVFSRSPEEHRDFFKNTFFTAIEISDDEFYKHEKWLHKIGLNRAAVTSPLKEEAFKLSTQQTQEASTLKSANTLFWKNETVLAHNTDMDGFKELVARAQIDKGEKVVIWGGGGTLTMMQEVLPNALFYSSRNGELKAGVANSFGPDVVIWSAPRFTTTKFPPAEWSPRLVVDLNYSENSMGLEYAQKLNCKYLSGISMFKVQAKQQQKFWSQP